MKYLLFVGLSLCLGCSDSNPLTFQNVMRVHDGMTYPEVVGIIGEPDDIYTETKPLNFHKTEIHATWGWKNPHHTPSVQIAFLDGIVASIKTYGIDPPSAK